jgi:2-methylcitrate dehydratase PrpD
MHRPDVVALARKVSLRLDPELDARFPTETLSRVTVRSDGRDFTSPATAPRGEASAPPLWAELEAKLRQASRFAATSAQQDQLIEACNRLRHGDHAPLLGALGAIRLDSASG